MTPTVSDSAARRVPRDGQDLARDTAWFFRLNPFQQAQALRRAQCEHPVFESVAPDVIAYLDSNGIERRSWESAVGSAQASCLNFLFPLRRDLKLAAHALRPMLPGVKEVRRIEFDFAGSLDPRDITPSEWLGEPKTGKRGVIRTTADSAIWWSDGEKPRATLVEWKYAESSFSGCPGLESCMKRRRHLWVRRCTNYQTAAIPADPEHRCYLSCGETSRVDRRYWDHMEEAGIDVQAVEARAVGCVFRGPFHHHMRHWLLAEFLRQHPADGEEQVDVCLVYFTGNTRLNLLPKWMRELGPDLPGAWRSVVTRPDDFRTCTVEEILSALDGCDECHDPSWRAFLRDRYGV